MKLTIRSINRFYRLHTRTHILPFLSAWRWAWMAASPDSLTHGKGAGLGRCWKAHSEQICCAWWAECGAGGRWGAHWCWRRMCQRSPSWLFHVAPTQTLAGLIFPVVGLFPHVQNEIGSNHLSHSLISYFQGLSDQMRLENSLGNPKKDCTFINHWFIITNLVILTAEILTYIPGRDRVEMIRKVLRPRHQRIKEKCQSYTEICLTFGEQKIQPHPCGWEPGRLGDRLGRLGDQLSIFRLHAQGSLLSRISLLLHKIGQNGSVLPFSTGSMWTQVKSQICVANYTANINFLVENRFIIKLERGQRQVKHSPSVIHSFVNLIKSQVPRRVPHHLVGEQ